MRLYQIQKSKMHKRNVCEPLGPCVGTGKVDVCFPSITFTSKNTSMTAMGKVPLLKILHSDYKMPVNFVFKSEHNHTLSASPSPKYTTILKVALCLDIFCKISFFGSTVWDDYYLGLSSMYLCPECCT